MIAEQHIRIFEAIRNGDGSKAGKEARKHIDFVESELGKIINEESPAGRGPQGIPGADGP